MNLPLTTTTRNEAPGQDYMVLGTGVNFQFTDSLSLMLNYSLQLFRQDMQAHFASVRFIYSY